MNAPSYRWSCHGCGSPNEPGIAACSTCGLQASATGRQIAVAKARLVQGASRTSGRTFGQPKSDSNRIQEVRAKWITGMLSILALSVAAYALVVKAPLAAIAFGSVAIFFALMLWLLPARWNRFMIDVLSNFGWY
jgi:hypothetical protein